MAREMEKRIEDVCSRILISSRNELYIHLRFFDVAEPPLLRLLCCDIKLTPSLENQ